MPTYAYRCENCGHEFDLFQSITAKPIRKCPACAKATVKRLVGTGSGIIFKGSGFYQTDYRSDTYKKAADSDKKAADSDKKVADSDKKAADSDKKVADSDKGGSDKKDAAKKVTAATPSSTVKSTDTTAKSLKKSA